MKVMKYEIARAIDKLKSVVQKNEATPALGGILVKDGRLISSNSEITIHIKFEQAKGENFIIPMKAFDLIKNLPEGEVEISTNEKHEVTIKTDKIKNKYQSFPAENFMYQNIPEDEEVCTTIPGEQLMSCISHVMYAAADKDPKKILTGIYLEGNENELNVVALDGHVLAWDKIKTDSGKNMQLIVPKAAAKKLLDMGMSDDVEVANNKHSVTFRTKDYIIYSRLIEGNYFSYKQMFKECPIKTVVNKKELAESMTRAKMCVRDETPTVFELEGDELKISLNDKETHYEEYVPTQQIIDKTVKIGFSSRLVLETIRAFTCENIMLNLTGATMPMIVEAEDSDMKALVLPVRIQ